MFFFRKFEDFLVNFKVRVEFVSYKDFEEKVGRFESILFFVSVNLILTEIIKGV